MSVYFAQAGPYIKAGYSANPSGRMATVTHNGERPADLPKGAHATLLGWIPGDRKREAEVHALFADQRVAGEWFTLDVNEVRDLVWSDPSGVDIERMSALAALTMLNHPEATRDDLTAAGVRVEGVPLDEVDWSFLIPPARVRRRAG